MTDEASRDAHEAARLCALIAPLLAGRGPGVQGAALADLLAMWIAGHNPDAREELLKNHVEAVRTLVPLNARIIGDKIGVPWE